MRKKTMLLIITLNIISLLTGCGKPSKTLETAHQKDVALRAFKALNEMNEMSEKAKSTGGMWEYYNFVRDESRANLKKEVLTTLPGYGNKMSEIQQALVTGLFSHDLASSSWLAINNNDIKSAKTLDEILSRQYKPERGRTDWVQSAINEFQTEGTYQGRDALLNKLWKVANTSRDYAVLILEEELEQ